MHMLYLARKTPHQIPPHVMFLVIVDNDGPTTFRLMDGNGTI